MDGSLEVGQRYSHVVLRDSGSGLSAARNLGISAASKPLLLNFGPDNEIDAANLALLLESFRHSKASGVGMLTNVEGSNYWADALNFWRTARFSPGLVRVIGTPSLFHTRVLKAFKFNESRRFSDDGELAERLLRAGHSLELAPSFAKEIGTAALPDIWVRWQMYGVSDAEYFLNHMYSGASLGTLVSSFFHALKNDVLLPIHNSPIRSIRFLPALITMGVARYSGMLPNLKRRKA